MKLIPLNIILLIVMFLTGCSKTNESETTGTVNPPSALTYDETSLQLERFQPLEFIHPRVSGDDLRYKIEPELPTGLKLNKYLGTISGIPQIATPEMIYKITAYNSAGESSFNIRITVTARPIPNIAYTQSRYELPIGQQIDTPILLQKSGAEYAGFTIDKPLPAGLMFNETDGSVTGIPTDFVPNSLHTITGTTTTGVYVYTSLLIQILDYPPSELVYTQNGVETTSFVQSRDTAILDIIPSYEGGVVESFSITPVLPTGLSFNTSTGIISGKPTQMILNTKYTITAKNSGGTVSKDIFIEVKDIPPTNLSYNQTTISLRRTIPVNTQIIPTYTGGEISLFSITPALPSGLSFNPVNGEISGTPTAVSTVQVYTVTGSNNGGTTSTTFNLFVRDLPPQNLSYPIVSEIYVKNTPITTLTPTSDGGAVAAYTVTPALPAGLTLNSLTGVISGTPTAVSGITSYIVRAINSEGQTPYAFFIAVKDEAPTNLTYSRVYMILEKGTPIAPVIPSNQKGLITSYNSNVMLPPGLELNPVTGIISGTPTSVAAEDSYRIIGKNSTGETSVEITITVNDKAPLSLSYGTNNYLFDRGVPILDLVPTSTGGTIVNYRVKEGQTLPSGLNLDATTGVISGVPGTRIVTQTVTIQGTNTGGMIERNIVFSINDYAPSDISYGQGTITFTFGQDLGADGLFPTNEGGDIDLFTITPDLPLGLYLNETTGAIMGSPINPNGGTPENPMGTGNPPDAIPYSASKPFTVSGFNSGGQTSKVVNLRIVPPRPIISLPAELSIQRDSNFAGLIPVMSGGVASEFLIQPSTLPVGLSFNTSTGAITGIPTQVTPAQTFIVRAKNDGGDASSTISIRITEIPPSNINYSSITTDFFGDENHYYEAGNWVWDGNVIANNTASSVTVDGFVYTRGNVFDDTKFLVKRVLSGNNNFTISRFLNDGVRTYPPVSSIPTAQGGPITAWTIDKPLPAGLFFDNITGEIKGVPSVSTASDIYTITAVNDGGSSSKAITLYIKDLPPYTLEYDAPSYQFGSGDEIVIPAPVATGGKINTFTISPAIHPGLTFNSSTGAISKPANSPTSSLETKQYTVQGCNPEGCVSTTFTLKITPDRPGKIAYTPTVIESDILHFTIGESKTYSAGVISGGAATSYTIASVGKVTPFPNFPVDRYTIDSSQVDLIMSSEEVSGGLSSLGLSLNTTTGAISGNPLPTLNHHFYLVGVMGLNDHPEPSLPSVLYIYINRKPVAHAGSNYSGIIGTAFNLNGSLSSDADRDLPWNFTTSTKGKELNYTWTLISKPENSVITSTSISNRNSVNPAFVPDEIGEYVFGLVVNDGLVNSNQSTVTITVNDVPPSDLHYKKLLIGGERQSNIIYNIGSNIDTTGALTSDVNTDSQSRATFSLYAFNAGGKVVNYSISPALPAGLSFNTATGVITGKPNNGFPPTNYTISATNTGGTTSTTIKLFGNVRPIANASSVAKVNLGNSAQLSGIASIDSDADYLLIPPFGPKTLTYYWKLIDKPSNSAMTDSSIIPSQYAMNPTFTPDVRGVYKFRLFVFDGYLLSEKSEVSFSAGTKPSNITFTDNGAVYKDSTHFAYNINSNVNIRVNFTADGSSDENVTVSNLPAGLSYNSVTKYITGTVANAIEPRDILVTVSNYGGELQASFELWINNKPDLSLSSPNLTYVSLGSPITMTATISDSDNTIINTAPYNVFTRSINWNLLALPAGSNLSSSSIIKEDLTGISSSTLNGIGIFTPNVAGTYIFDANYNDGLISSNSSNTIKSTTVNLPTIDSGIVARLDNSYMEGRPLIKAGKNGILKYTMEIDTVNLVANPISGASYLWEVVSHPEGIDVVIDTPNASSAMATLEVDGSYIFKLTVTNGTSSSSKLLFVNSEDPSVYGAIPSIISTNRTLSLENSPYTLDGDVIIRNNSTLSIPKGITVNGNGYKIILESGSLNIVGENDSFVHLDNISIIKQTTSNANITMEKVFAKDLALCAILDDRYDVPCKGIINIKESTFVGLKGDQRINSDGGQVDVEKNIFISSNGFTLRGLSNQINVQENYIYNALGGLAETPTDRFFANVLENQSSRVNIIKNRFVNPNNYKLIKHINGQPKLNIKYNYWLDSFNINDIKNRIENNINTDIFPFFTTPDSNIKDGRSFF